MCEGGGTDESRSETREWVVRIINWKVSYTGMDA